MIRLHLVSAYKMRSQFHTGEIPQYEKFASAPSLIHFILVFYAPSDSAIIALDEYR